MTVLPPDLVTALAEVGRRRPLLVASDYDGVLARLRDDPAAAVPESGITAALARLAAGDGVTVALVSGRGVEDLRVTSGLTGPFRWVGSHGAEFDGPLDAGLSERRDVLAARLAPLVAEVPGARLEVKPASVAVHVRQVADRDAAGALLGAAGAVADATLTAKPGKDVLELAVTDADKGSAVARLRAELGAAAVVYLGDDVTDEDAFATLTSTDIGIKVGDGDTAAGFRVEDHVAVLAVLEAIADARS